VSYSTRIAGKHVLNAAGARAEKRERVGFKVDLANKLLFQVRPPPCERFACVNYARCAAMEVCCKTFRRYTEYHRAVLRPNGEMVPDMKMSVWRDKCTHAERKS
jgi:hypothetical protein